MKQYYLDLFAGIGGFALGAYWAEMRFHDHYFSEVDDYATRVYQKRFPDAIPLGDIRTIQGRSLPEGRWIITGGFPCQDISVAGKGAGLDGERSDPGYGLNTRDLLAKYDQPSQSWRTSAPSLFEDLTEFSDRLPKSGMMRNGRIYGPAIWARPTGGSGFGLLPTPKASDGERFKRVKYQHIKKVVQRNISSGTMFSLKLPEIILWNFKKEMNLSFAEWMMGFPAGWTDLNASVTPLSLKLPG